MIETLIAPNPGAFTLDGTRTYIIDRSVVIDPGPAIDSHIAAILEHAPRLEAILVTHRHGDHAPAALPLHEATGAPIYAAAGVVTMTVAHELTRDEALLFRELRIEAIASPGHTAEHFCFLTADGDLFTGDTILGEGTTVIFPPDGHMQSYLATLRKLRALKPRAIYPGHGPIRRDAIELITQYIAHREMRERQVADAFRGGARSAEEIRGKIYVDLDPRLHRAAELQIEAHLTHLRETGRV